MGQAIFHTKKGSHRVFEEGSFPITIEYSYRAEGGTISKRYELQLNQKGLCLVMQKKVYEEEGEDGK